MGFALTPLLILNGLLGLAALVVEVAAFVIALKAPSGAYVAAGKLTKPAWAAITAVAMVIGLGAAPVIGSGQRFGGLLSIASVVAALVFMVDVRPALKAYGGRPGPRPSGPDRPGGW